MWLEVLHAQIERRNAVERDPYERLINSHQRLRAELGDANLVVAELKEKQWKSETDRKDLLKQVRSLESTLGGVTVRTGREEELEAKCSMLQEKVNGYLAEQKDYYKSMYEAQQLKEENKHLATETTRLRDRDDNREGMLVIMKNEYETLKEENDALRAKITRIQTDADRCIREAVSAKDVNARLQEQVLALEEEVNVCRRQRDQAMAAGGHVADMGAQLSQSGHFNASLVMNATAGGSSGPVATEQDLSRARDSLVPQKLWKKVENPHGSAGVLYAVCSKENGDRIFTSGSDRYIRTWDTQSLNNTQQQGSGDIALSMDSVSRYLLAGCADSTARFWDLETQRSVQLTGHGEKIVAAYLSRSAQHAFTASSDRTIKLWDVASRAMQRTIMCASSCNDLCIANESIYSAHYNGSVLVWDRRTPRACVEVEHVHARGVTCVRITPDGTGCVTLGRDNCISYRDIRKLQEPRFVIDHPSISVSTNLARFTISPDGRLVVVGNTQGNVLCFDISPEMSARSSNGFGGTNEVNRAPVVELKGGHQRAVHAVAWGPIESNIVASIGDDKRVILWK